jgi:hypothetical protein
VSHSRRSALVVLLLGISLLLVFLFRSFLLENFLRPVALVLWLLVRTVQSVDQQVYWYVLIASAVIYAFVRFSRELNDTPPDPPPETNVTLENINLWRVLIPFDTDPIGKSDILKQNLGKMLATIYTSRQSEAVHWEIDEALRLGRIPLPKSIYTFLFPADPSGDDPSLRRIPQKVLRVPETLARRWSGRDEAQYYRSIEEVLAFMESSMEKKHDDKSIRTHTH